MAAWISSLDFGINSVVACHGGHAVDVRVRVDVKGRVTLIAGVRIRVEIWTRVR